MVRITEKSTLGKKECISVGRVRCRDGVMSGSGSRNFSCFKIERSRLFSWKSSFETLPSKSKLFINFVSYVLSSAEKRWCLSSCSYYTEITFIYLIQLFKFGSWKLHFNHPLMISLRRRSLGVLRDLVRDLAFALVRLYSHFRISRPACFKLTPAWFCDRHWIYLILFP